MHRFFGFLILAIVMIPTGLVHAASGMLRHDSGPKPFYLDGRQFEGQGRERLGSAPVQPDLPNIRDKGFDNNTKIDEYHEQTRGRLSIEGRKPTRDELTRWQNPDSRDARIR